MSKRLIMATSGGFIATGYGTRRLGATFLKALELTGKDRPRVCFVLTASGDEITLRCPMNHSLITTAM